MLKSIVDQNMIDVTGPGRIGPQGAAAGCNAHIGKHICIGLIDKGLEDIIILMVGNLVVEIANNDDILTVKM